MLNVQNEIARTEPNTAHEASAQAELSGLSSAVADTNIHDLRRQHAETWSSTMLGQADRSPVANIQQTIQTPGQEVSISAEVTRGINAQALENANTTAAQLRAMGFSPDAIARAQELVRHHTVSAQGSSVTQVSSSREQAEAQPLDQRQDQNIELQESLENQQPQVLEERDTEVEELMGDLAATIEQDETFAPARAAKTELEVTQEIADPLENSPYMKFVATEELARPVAAANGRFDLSFSDPIAVATAPDDQLSELRRMDLASRVQRFDYQAPGTTSSQRLSADVETPVAVAPTRAGPLRLDRDLEFGETAVRGRERISRFLAAA